MKYKARFLVMMLCLARLVVFDIQAQSQPAATLLLHANELNADYFDELVNLMKKRGYTFITLEDALKDKAYSLPEAQSKIGLSWIHRWMLAKGLEMRPEPPEPEWIANLNKSYSRQ